MTWVTLTWPAGVGEVLDALESTRRWSASAGDWGVDASLLDVCRDTATVTIEFSARELTGHRRLRRLVQCRVQAADRGLSRLVPVPQHGPQAAAAPADDLLGPILDALKNRTTGLSSSGRRRRWKGPRPGVAGVAVLAAALTTVGLIVVALRRRAR
ncbi:MAG: hypothetical protein EKK42_22025 [Pseudonocardiaceae bacterium]|nr:MAG: hypothetical protein ABS80_00460 [Pseudonocardia sp. SCN 72-51]RTL65240.1 MAG: hypothetical protein EKK42_22025 [Pseudonocardiaceae bacterium]